MAKLDPFTHYHVEGECWVWNGATSARGYAVCGGERSGRRSVSRIFYQRHVRPLREGEVLRRNPDCLVACVNPAHHEPMLRGEIDTRPKNPATIGVHPRRTPNLCGKDLHDITHPGSLYFAPDGTNQCRSCRRLADLRRKRRAEIKKCGCGTPVGQAV